MAPLRGTVVTVNLLAAVLVPEPGRLASDASLLGSVCRADTSQEGNTDRNINRIDYRQSLPDWSHVRSRQIAINSSSMTSKRSGFDSGLPRICSFMRRPFAGSMVVGPWRLWHFYLPVEMAGDFLGAPFSSLTRIS